MAKQQFNVNPTPAQVTNTPGIAAYKGGALRDKYSSGELTSVPEGKELIGFSFEFSKGFNNKFIKIRRVFYASTVEGNPYFDPDMEAENEIILPQADGYFLKNPQIPSSFQGINAQLIEYYKQVGFVFFTLDQLRPLLDLANEESEIVVSGCEIDLGLMAYEKHETDALRIDKCFSLKIEASIPVEADENASGKMDEPTISLFALGHPCPPKWYPLSSGIQKVAADLHANGQVLTPSQLLSLKNSWDNLVGTIKKNP